VADGAASLNGDSPLEVALAGGSPQCVGWFRFYYAAERWEWSPQVAQMHGYEPGSVTPTTELVLSHKHPDDYSQVATTLEEIRRSHSPFSTRHRIIDTHGRTHHVVVVGERLHDDAGELIGTHGFYVEVTPLADDHQSFITEAVAEIAENQAVIEQVKGVLMVIYGIDADAAFEVLKWRSQQTNVKLRVLAEQLMADFRALSYVEAPPSRSTFDRVLLTTQERIAAGQSD
jgi:fructose-specific component phosphotransferase system IIB-like protein